MDIALFILLGFAAICTALVVIGIIVIAAIAVYKVEQMDKLQKDYEMLCHTIICKEEIRPEYPLTVFVDGMYKLKSRSKAN